MSEMNFEQMIDASFKTIHTGEVVEGTVIDVKPDEAVINIGYKSDGILTRNEYTNESGVDMTTMLKVGDTMEVKVLKVNDGEGQVTLSYKRLAVDRGNKRIEEAFNNKEVLSAVVTEVLSGGLCVVVDEVRIFIPASLVSDIYEKDLNKYAGQEIQFVVTEYNPRRRRYIGDRKQLVVAEKAIRQKELFERIQEGDVVEGVVKNVTDFGAFIDLGGADGLLHISRSSRLFTTGGATSGQTVCCPSVVMVMLLHLSPPAVMNSSMAVTVPETLEWIGADRKASESPSSCPTVTVSFTLTRGSQGAPICWSMGMTTFSGTGILTAALPAVFLQCLTLTPFNALLNNDGTCTSLPICCCAIKITVGYGASPPGASPR